MFEYVESRTLKYNILMKIFIKIFLFRIFPGEKILPKIIVFGGVSAQK